MGKSSSTCCLESLFGLMGLGGDYFGGQGGRRKHL